MQTILPDRGDYNHITCLGHIYAKIPWISWDSWASYYLIIRLKGTLDISGCMADRVTDVNDSGIDFIICCKNSAHKYGPDDNTNCVWQCERSYRCSGLKNFI